MKKIRILCLLFAFMLLLHVPAVAATEPTETTHSTTDTTAPTTESSPYENGMGDSSVASGSHSINAQMPVWGKDKLLETAGAAMLYEINSDTLVYSWNADQQIHPASLVKIMTCLLALENCELTEMVTVTSTAMATLPKDTTINFISAKCGAWRRCSIA